MQINEIAYIDISKKELIELWNRLIHPISWERGLQEIYKLKHTFSTLNALH